MSELTRARILRYIRARERADAEQEKGGTGATGYTLLKQQPSPMVELLSGGKESVPEELRAAEDIKMAFMALSGALFIRPLSLEKQDRSHDTGHWPAKVAQSVRNYQCWAKYWSFRRNQLRDPTLEITISAVVDERPIYVIALDHSRSEKMVKRVIRSGLRSFAALAGWVDPRRGEEWMRSAFIRLRNKTGT